MEHIFICYSRADRHYALQLKNALEKHDKVAWIDLEDLPASSSWREEIRSAIIESVAFIYLVSSDSLRSEYCQKEFDFARELNKRVFPILLPQMEDKIIPESISTFQWLRWDDFGNDFNISKLIKDTETDYEWVKFITGLGIKTAHWEKQKDGSQLLWGRELQTAEQQLASAGVKNPQPIDSHRRYILESRRNEERQRRQVIIGLSLGLIIMIVLSVFAWTQRNDAKSQQATAQAASTRAIAQESIANTQESIAKTNEAEAKHQANIALARQLAAQAQPLFADSNSNQMTAVLLAIQSMRIFPSVDAAQPLQNTTLTDPIATMTYDSWISSVAFSPDGKYVVSGGCDLQNAISKNCDESSARVWEVVTRKEVARMTHDGRVSSLAFSPDGKYVISGSWDKTARVWEAATGKEISRMPHDGGVNSVAFSPDGRYAVSGGGDGTARVWEANTGKEISRMVHDFYMTENYPVNSVAFSPDGRYVASSGGITARVWDRETGKEIARITTPNNTVESVAFSTDSKYVISVFRGSFDYTARVWEAATGKEISRMKHDYYVISAAFSPDGKYVVSGSWDKTARVWEASTGKEISRMTYENQVYTVAFSPNGKYVVSGEGSIAQVWEASTGKETARMMHDGNVSSATFSLDNKYVVSGGGTTARVWESTAKKEVAHMIYDGDSTVAFSPDDKYVVYGDGVWETVTGNEISHVSNDSRAKFLAFSPDGKYVVFEDLDNTFHVWVVSTGKEIASMKYGDWASSATFSPDSKYVVSAGCDQQESSFDNCAQGSARVWEAATGKEIARLTYYNNGSVYPVTFSPDSKYVVSGGCDKLTAGGLCAQGSARVWEVGTGKEITHMIHDDRVRYATFSPDGKYIVSGSDDGIVRVWEVRTGKEITHMTHNGVVNTTVFSPDSKYVVSGGGYGDNTARVWEAVTGKEIARMMHESGVTSVAFSPDGKYVVSGSLDGTSRLWEVATGKEIARMTHGNSVNTVAFSLDGKYVVSAGCDQREPDFNTCTQGSARVWIWQPTDLITEFCSRVTRNLTHDEWKQYIGEMLPYQAVCPNLPLDLEYINVIAKNILSNTNERNRVDTALDSVKTELTKYDVVKDPTAESLRIVSVATVQQISTEAANGYIEKTLDLLEQARKAEITISVEEKNSINKAIARNALSNSSDPNRIKTAVDIVKTELIKDGIVKDPSAESLKIVSESTVNQILLDAALDTENALGLLKQARQMQIEISINDKNSISASIDSAIFRVSVEDIEKAVAIYNLAEQMQIPVEDPYAIKGLCWFGSLQGHENQTLQYCETAVKLAPQDALIRDSRGLARALTGDFEGAILDFQFFIDEKIKGGNEQNIDVKRRQQWIVDLKVGKNPFTPEVLKTLKSGQLAY